MKPSYIQSKVKSLLINYPHLRDDDFKLTANVWHSEMVTEGKSSTDALSVYAAGLLTPAESITRCRRKIQEMHPELRGEKYEGRQKEQELVKEDLRTNFHD